MFIKKLLIIVSFLILTSNIFALECSFDNTGQCQRTTSSFNTFTLNFDNSAMLDYYEASLYNQENEMNKIPLSSSGNTLSQLQPLIEPGVYVIEIDAYTKGGKVTNNKTQFIFDNTQQLPPVIEGQATSQIRGTTQFPNTDVIANINNGASTLSAISNSDSEFQMNLNNLNSGINYVKFYTQSSNGLTSAPIERIITSNNIVENENIATTASISDLLINERTINNAETYYTSKRNFYVYGTTDGTNGAEIYVNGVRAVVANGQFAAFVLLNEGENDIIVKSGSSQLDTQKVFYSNFKFQFLTFDFEKIISTPSTTIDIITNYDLPFNVFVNGKYQNTYNQGSITLNGLKPGKNYIYIQGYNNQDISEIIYYDTQNPQLEILTPLNLASVDEFVFRATDDIGIDTNDLSVTLTDTSSNQQYQFAKDQISIEGDFYLLDISNLPYSNYNLHFNVKDRVGKLASQPMSNTLSVSMQNTMINYFEIEDGTVRGNNLFVKSGQQTIVLIPSKYVVFNKIFLDGEELTNYDIKSDGSVFIEIDFEKDKGILEMTFLDSLSNTPVNMIYNYFTDDENPQIFLDYIQNPYTDGQRYVRVTGEITDSHLDWSSLSFNGNNDFLRFGKYFEAYLIPQGNSNLVISAYDNSLNKGESIFGSVFEIDDSNLNIQSSQAILNLGLSATITSSPLRIKHFAYSFDGFETQGTYLKRNFLLPSQQRNGFRSLNLKGKSNTQNSINSIISYSVDSLSPKIYFIDTSSNLQVIIDGTGSPVNTQSAQFTINSLPSENVNLCSNYEKVSKYDICYEFPSGSSITLQIEDEAGNIATSDNAFSSLPTQTSALEIYFNGNDRITTQQDYFIQGQLISGAPVQSITTNIQGSNCEFDDISFVCLVRLSEGENTISVTARTSRSTSVTNSYLIELLTQNPIIEISSISGDGLYIREDINTYVEGVLDLSAILDRQALVKLFVNGREMLSDRQNANFNLQFSLEDQVAQKSNDEIEIWLEAEDENGLTSTSEKILINFKRVLETLVSIIIK